MYLVTKWFGTFILDKNENIRDRILFPKDTDKIAEKLIKIDKKEILDEEKKIVKDYEDIIVNERRLEDIGNFISSDSYFKDVEIKPEDFGFSRHLLHDASIKVTENKVEGRLKRKDLHTIQMVEALDDMRHISNLLSERIDSWSNLPETEKKIKPVESSLSKVEEDSKKLAEQIESNMNELAPNVSDLIGPLIGARLLSHAGGLKKLAFLPASTIQVLGAEKALFRYKKSGGKPPKHGVIFQHPSINKANRDDRGKIARALASKIAIAVKADAFTGRNISEDLLDDLEERIEEIKNE